MGYRRNGRYQRKNKRPHRQDTYEGTFSIPKIVDEEKQWREKYISENPPPQTIEQILLDRERQLEYRESAEKQRLIEEMGLRERLAGLDKAIKLTQLTSSVISIIATLGMLVWLSIHANTLYFGIALLLAPTILMFIALLIAPFAGAITKGFEGEKEKILLEIDKEVRGRTLVELEKEKEDLLQNYDYEDKLTAWNSEYEKALEAWRKEKQKRIQMLQEKEGLRNLLNQISAAKFEAFVADIYSLRGYKTALTGNSADGGLDVIADDGYEVLFIQCKHYKNRRVGVQVVRELLGVSASEAKKRPGKLCRPVLAYTFALLTEEAKRFAAENEIEVLGVEEIVALAQELQLAVKKPYWQQMLQE